MREFTLILPYYENAGMLRVQQDAWRELAPDIRARLHAIVVDDGSPTNPAVGCYASDTGLASYRHYRITVDVRWNWLACRNLGVKEATTDWMLLTDIDHVVPEGTWRRLMHGKLDETKVYRFSRIDAPNLTPYKPHPNSWCMTRGMFDRIGGYDERFSGNYGTDGEFRDRVQATASSVVMLPQALIRYPRDVVPDASTTQYGRKEPQDRVNVSAIRKQRETIPNWRPLRGTFPWERLI